MKASTVALALSALIGSTFAKPMNMDSANRMMESANRMDANMMGSTNMMNKDMKMDKTVMARAMGAIDMGLERNMEMEVNKMMMMLRDPKVMDMLKNKMVMMSKEMQEGMPTDKMMSTRSMRADKMDLERNMEMELNKMAMMMKDPKAMDMLKNKMVMMGQEMGMKTDKMVSARAMGAIDMDLERNMEMEVNRMMMMMKDPKAMDMLKNRVMKMSEEMKEQDMTMEDMMKPAGEAVTVIPTPN